MNRDNWLKNNDVPAVAEWEPGLGDIMAARNNPAYEYYIERVHEIRCLHRETYCVYDVISADKKYNHNGISMKDLKKEFRPTGRVLPKGEFSMEPIE